MRSQALLVRRDAMLRIAPQDEACEVWGVGCEARAPNRSVLRKGQPPPPFPLTFSRG